MSEDKERCCLRVHDLEEAKRLCEVAQGVGIMAGVRAGGDMVWMKGKPEIVDAFMQGWVVGSAVAHRREKTG